MVILYYYFVLFRKVYGVFVVQKIHYTVACIIVFPLLCELSSWISSQQEVDLLLSLIQNMFMSLLLAETENSCLAWYSNVTEYFKTDMSWKLGEKGLQEKHFYAVHFHHE